MGGGGIHELVQEVMRHDTVQNGRMLVADRDGKNGPWIAKSLYVTHDTFHAFTERELEGTKVPPR